MNSWISGGAALPVLREPPASEMREWEYNGMEYAPLVSAIQVHRNSQ